MLPIPDGRQQWQTAMSQSINSDLVLESEQQGAYCVTGVLKFHPQKWQSSQSDRKFPVLGSFNQTSWIDPGMSWNVDKVYHLKGWN